MNLFLFISCVWTSVEGHERSRGKAITEEMFECWSEVIQKDTAGEVSPRWSWSIEFMTELSHNDYSRQMKGFRVLVLACPFDWTFVSADYCTVAEKCKTNHDSENKITNYKRKCKSKKQNNNPENIITSQKTQGQIRQTGRGRYSLRQHHWFGNRLLTADWTRHLSIKVYRTRSSTAESVKSSAPVVQMVDLMSLSFWCDRPAVRSHLLPNFFFLPFQISYRIVKAFIFNKN